jgi:hypothetical protein
MPDPTPRPIAPPRGDDRPLWNVVCGLTGLPAVLVAHDLKLFPLLAERPRSVAEVSAALAIAPRPAAALLTLCASLGLLELRGASYALTAAAADYLLESSPTYFGGFLEVALMSNPAVYAYDSLKRAVLSDAPQAYGGRGLFESHEQQAELARRFTRAMHGHSVGPALVWPELIDCAAQRVLLDVGGGSGAHTIGALGRWPHLRGIILDMPPVCEVAAEHVARHGLAPRVTLHAADLWDDPFPAADLHLYADIFHDWPPERCRFLAQKSCASLPSGGRILVHEMLLDDDKTGPFAAAAYNVAMLIWTQGQQHTGAEIAAILRDAGFVDVAITPTTGYWSVVAGRKP